MLIPKNNANQMRTRILIKIAESYFADKFKNADRIPLELRPKEQQPSRCCIYKDRAVLKYRCMSSLGFSPEEETDELKSLAQYGEEALERTHPEKAQLCVIDVACSACIKAQYMVTNACRGCFARPCQMNCPKEAISFVNGRAHIDPDKCVNCGKCHEVCPYHSIIRIPVPCEEACPVGAITKDEFGKEHINHETCISCGKCLQSCPFGAIVERSQMVDVLKLINETDKQVVAMLAPAIVGQFPGDIGNVVGALKKAGFSDVIEVAVGADITTKKEAAEFIEKMENGEKTDDHLLLPGLLPRRAGTHSRNSALRFAYQNADVLYGRTGQKRTSRLRCRLHWPLPGQTRRSRIRSERRLCSDL